MSFDVTSPLAGNVLQSYGPAGFTVNNSLHPSSILLATQFLAPFSGELTTEALTPLLEAQPLEFIILGMGKQLLPVPPALRQALRARGLMVDSMDTGAACRTYAAMHSEGRRVGAALLLPS